MVLCSNLHVFFHLFSVQCPSTEHRMQTMRLTFRPLREPSAYREYDTFLLNCLFLSNSLFYPRPPNLYLEAAVDCVGKPWILIQCSCLIAPLCGYESALWRTQMLLSNAGRNIADWLLRGFIQCANLRVLLPWSIKASAGYFRAVGMAMFQLRV